MAIPSPTSQIAKFGALAAACAGLCLGLAARPHYAAAQSLPGPRIDYALATRLPAPPGR